MRATIEYTDHLILRDGKKVFQVLAENNVKIIKTKLGTFVSQTRVIIEVKNYDEINMLLAELNRRCTEGVKLIKVRGDGIFSKLRRKTNETGI